jgi:tetratricopeptide (TPR) repeat protein
MRPSVRTRCGLYRASLQLRPSRGWLVLLLATSVVLGACTAPDPSVSPLRLPTRIPRTPTPIPTVTPTPFAIAAQTYYEEGRARQEADDLEGALQSFTWAIQRAPDFAPAYVARGTVYLAQGRFPQAVADADAALEADPTNAAAYALRGEALRALGMTRLALGAFDQALGLNPDLGVETFRSRWLVARDEHDGVRLLKLSNEYADTHPDDSLRYYYRGWAFVEMGRGSAAAGILVEGIGDTPDPSALLWFALGHAYTAAGDWQNAVTALEAARVLVQAGDVSLNLHSDQPVVDLFDALGRAYLGAGRCVDAETMLMYAIDIGAPASNYDAILREARLCQTPTPTPTPYLTATPG